MTNTGRQLALMVVVTATIGCDRVTKHVAQESLAGMPAQSFLSDTIRLDYIENTGAFLGFGADWPETLRVGLFTIGTALILVGTVVSALRFHWSGVTLTGLSLILGGGTSNLVDRVTRGAVVDFMNVGVGPLRTGIFNVADVAIMLGVAFVVFANYFRADHGT